jgi:hypothetical protein
MAERENSAATVRLALVRLSGMCRPQFLACCIAGRLGLPSELEERFGDEVEGLTLDLSMHVTAAAQAELLCDHTDGHALAGELQVRRDVANASVCDAVQFHQSGVIRAVQEDSHRSGGGIDAAGKVTARERQHARQVTQGARACFQIGDILKA